MQLGLSHLFFVVNLLLQNYISDWTIPTIDRKHRGGISFEKKIGNSVFQNLFDLVKYFLSRYRDFVMVRLTSKECIDE